MGFGFWGLGFGVCGLGFGVWVRGVEIGFTARAPTLGHQVFEGRLEPTTQRLFGPEFSLKLVRGRLSRGEGWWGGGGVGSGRGSRRNARGELASRLLIDGVWFIVQGLGVRFRG